MSRFLKIIGYILAGCLLLLFSFVTIIDRTPLPETTFYQQAHEVLDTFRAVHAPGDSLSAGWYRLSITPSSSMPMAGYRPRSSFETIHDSLYAHVLVISNQRATIALVSLDLLIFPPALRDVLMDKIKGAVDFAYLGASHTHNGIGGWDPTLAGGVIAGNYSPLWIDSISTQLVEAIQSARKTQRPATFSYGEMSAPELISNRLRSGPVDDRLRVLTVERDDRSRACFFTYGAHANCISKHSRALSADYPGKVVEKLQRNGYQFAMYMAGSVGSCRIGHTWFSHKDDMELIDAYSENMSGKIIGMPLVRIPSGELTFARMPIPLGRPQMRLTKDLRLRPWAFEWGLGTIKGELAMVKIGHLTMIGTPCDFSGELYGRFFYPLNKRLMITSFNGDYVGYITEDSAYDTVNRAEVMNLNWVGPYHGRYFSELIARLIEK